MSSSASLSRIMTYYQRRLPHWHPPGANLFITWRLYGSLPRIVPPPREGSTAGQRFVHYDRVLDKTKTGPLWLKDGRIAESTVAALEEGRKRKMFELRAYA